MDSLLANLKISFGGLAQLVSLRWGFVAAVPFWIITTAASQEAVRMSLAGEAAAAARHKAALMPNGSSLRLGPTAWSFTTGVDIQANDNIQFDSKRPKADVAFRPQAGTHMLWSVSDKTSIDLAANAGYSAYVQHSELNRFFVGPGSELAFDLYAGDFWFNFHERLSLTENAYEDPTVVGAADYSQLQNTAGLTSTWDLNKLIFRSGFDYSRYAVVTGSAGVPEGQSEVGSLSASYRFGPEFSTGVETGGSLIQYRGDNAAVRRATDWNAGTFLAAQPTEHMQLTAGAGYTVYTPERASPSLPSTEFTGAYARLGLNHKLNRYVQYALSAGRNISFGFFGGTIDLYSVVLNSQWQLFQKLRLGMWFEFEHGTQVLVGHEQFDRFGPGISLDREITRKVSGTLRYQSYQRSSDMSGGDYAVNILTFGLLVRL